MFHSFYLLFYCFFNISRVFAALQLTNFNPDSALEFVRYFCCRDFTDSSSLNAIAVCLCTFAVVVLQLP